MDIITYIGLQFENRAEIVRLLLKMGVKGELSDLNRDKGSVGIIIILSTCPTATSLEVPDGHGDLPNIADSASFHLATEADL